MKVILVGLLAALLMLPLGAAAQVPDVISFQGYVSNSDGEAISGTYDLTFRLYGAASGGTAIWSEVLADSEISDGIFDVRLGASNPITGELLSAPLWIGIQIGADPELAPRTLLSSVPFSLRSASLDAGAVTTEALADGSVTAGKLALPLTLSSPSSVTLTASNTSNDGTGIAGHGFGRGVIGSSSSGIGVSGASQVGGGVLGVTGGGFYAAVEGRADSDLGTAVLGRATSTTGVTYGVRGISASPDGFAGYFEGRVRATGEIQTEEGIRFADGTLQASAAESFVLPLEATTAVPHSTVLRITNTATTESGGAVEGVVHATQGMGLRGDAISNTGFTTGVGGFARSPTGTGVRGQNTSFTGETIGVRGLVWSSSGTGLHGHANSLTGATFGVRGEVGSPDGFAGYFTGGRGLYATGLTIGESVPRARLTLRGPDDAVNGPTVLLFGNTSDQVESGRIRFVEGTANPNWRGAYIHFDGAANLFHLGVHPTSDGDHENDVNAITIRRSSTPLVGIGVEAPSERLDVAGRVRATEFVTTSDARLKTDVLDLHDALEVVMQLRGVSYAWNDDATPGGADRHVGFLAQEVQRVLPEVVREDDHGTLSIAYSQLVPILVEAIKAQQATIMRLEKLEAIVEQLVSLQP